MNNSNKNHQIYLPDLLIAVLLQRVNIAPQGTLKHDRILWNYAQSCPKIMKSNGADINAIYQHLPDAWVHNAE
jgi:hypothetical protein